MISKDGTFSKSIHLIFILYVRFFFVLFVGFVSSFCRWSCPGLLFLFALVFMGMGFLFFGLLRGVSGRIGFVGSCFLRWCRFGDGRGLWDLVSRFFVFLVFVIILVIFILALNINVHLFCQYHILLLLFGVVVILVKKIFVLVFCLHFSLILVYSY